MLQAEYSPRGWSLSQQTLPFVCLLVIYSFSPVALILCGCWRGEVGGEWVYVYLISYLCKLASLPESEEEWHNF